MGHLGTAGGDCGLERRAVGVVDLAGAGSAPPRSEFGAGRDHDDAHATEHRHFFDAGGGQCAKMARGEAKTRGQQRISDSQITPALAHELAGGAAADDRHRIGGGGRVFDRHHGIRSLRYSGTGHDAHGGPFDQWRWSSGASRDLAHDRKGHR